MRDAGGVAVSVIAEGSEDASRFSSLLEAIPDVEIVRVPEGATSDPSKLKAIADGASAHWILLIRGGERIGPRLAGEIAISVAGSRAWGYRLTCRPTYCGRTLKLSRPDPGDVRLFHRRKARLQPDARMKVNGTVVRLSSTIDLVVYDTVALHVAALENSGRRPVGGIRRLTTWLADIVRHLPGSLDRSTAGYLWIESGWSKSGVDSGG